MSVESFLVISIIIVLIMAAIIASDRAKRAVVDTKSTILERLNSMRSTTERVHETMGHTYNETKCVSANTGLLASATEANTEANKKMTECLNRIAVLQASTDTKINVIMGRLEKK